MDGVISLLSSDEEDSGNGNGLRSHRPKNNSIKHLKSKQLQLTDKFPPLQKGAQTTVVRVPQNNNTKQNITVIRGYKKSIPVVQVNDGKSTESHKVVNSTSGVTIKPVINVNANANSHGQFSSSNKNLIVAKQKMLVNAPRVNVVSISPSNNVTVAPKLTPTIATVVTPTVTPRMAPTVASTVTPTVAPTVSSVDPSRPAKRVNPTKISDSVMNRASSIEKSSDSDMLSRDSSVAANDETTQPTAKPQNQANGTSQSKENNEPPPKRPKVVSNEKIPIHDDYKELMNTCKAAESSDEMKKVIAKLEKYYHRAHPDYVKSKSFHKLVKSVTNDVKTEPSLVYIKISSLLEELKTRRTMEGAKVAVENTVETEVDEKKTKRIQKLSEALQKLQKRIRRSEEEEVDWDDEYNSNYLLTERYKKRAFEIYSKICDLTGESRNAERIIKKPIRFRGTEFPEFNRKLEKFVNETKSFPDMFDVLRIMDHCNKDYKYNMSTDTRRIVAQEAFTKIGTLLQERRKRDLYEMVQYYTSSQKDPAREDPDLKVKLDENHRIYTNRMDEVIDRFTRRQHRDSSEENENSPNRSDTNKANSSKKPKVPTTSGVSSAQTAKSTQSESKRQHQPSKPLQPSQPSHPLPIQVKMDADLEINDADMDLIIPDDLNDVSKDDGLRLINDEEMQEIEKEIPTGLFPTITSVTSLHPSVDRFNEFFDSNALESSNIL